jgi:hypothetical protein
MSSLIIGARTLTQLQDNLNTVTWSLTPDEVARLDQVSATAVPYPYWHQRKFNAERMPISAPQEKEKELVGAKK